MGLVAAKCTSCGANIEVDISHDAGICKFCGTAFITEKAINNYITNITNNITNNTNITAQNVHIHNDEINKFFVVEDGVLTKYNGRSKTIKIPEGILEIGDDVFKDIEFEEILIPSSVIRIHKDAFTYDPENGIRYGQGKILFAPNSKLKHLEDHVFYHNYIYLVQVPKSVTKIDEEAFYEGQTILTEIDSKKFIDKFEDSLLLETNRISYNDIEFENLIIGNYKEIKKINGFEFACCSDNTACVINFKETKNKETLEFPKLDNYKITSLSRLVYLRANDYTNVILPNGLTSIPSHAFNGFSSIKYIFIPKTVREIGLHGITIRYIKGKNTSGSFDYDHPTIEFEKGCTLNSWNPYCISGERYNAPKIKGYDFNETYFKKVTITSSKNNNSDISIYLPKILQETYLKFSWLFKKPNYWIINCNPYYTINNQTYVNIMAGYIKPGESKTIILPRGIHAELKINKNNKRN